MRKFLLPGWQSMSGLQFENLVLNNRELLHQALCINPADIVANGSYFQRKTNRQKGCQIDYLIQTKYNTLFACEIKFTLNTIGKDIIEEVKEKIARISVSRGFAILPVLIHASDITEAVDEANYFSYVINFSEYLR
jgi:hypothetical protein